MSLGWALIVIGSGIVIACSYGWWVVGDQTTHPASFYENGGAA